ncbi:restriction endonuclease subunit S [Bifidobacterium adolescentis]|uniref:restriction endonuclease subunit S n=1 Tax=Bifidobacterium adolescentis TaxID=1680 RepID=UPI000A18C41F|nr:restriction endonuclease subunit S [Bifidobacterium adolescentis]OSG89095.1 Type IC specificity subunit [Bifidobacterium adolescentis]
MAEQHGKALVPQIRFAGFTDPWEQRKLGELCSFSKGCGYSKNDLRDQGTPIILYGRLYTNYETQIHSVDTFVKPLENSVYSEGGEVIIPASGETAEDISIASVVEKPGIILGGDLNVITSSADIDPVFLALELSYGKPHFDLAKRAQGKSVVHIHNEDIANVFFGHPNIAEQRRIGAFFDRLDSLITLHQRKYDKLCVLKKSMLDKMFPKGGSLYPEIRFAGFTDPWEQRKLGELTESYSGGTPAAGESEFYGGSIPFIRSAEIAAESTELFLTEKGYESSSARMVKPGDVLYALYGATSGEVAVSRQKGAINQAILAILPRDDCDARYITAWLRKQKGYIVTTYLQGGQGNLSGVIVKNLEVFIPSLPEQQKIGFMLSHLDSLITLHQRKLELLRNIKKSMLDKMFV